jgi:hypothetical protein
MFEFYSGGQSLRKVRQEYALGIRRTIAKTFSCKYFLSLKKIACSLCQISNAISRSILIPRTESFICELTIFGN